MEKFTNKRGLKNKKSTRKEEENENPFLKEMEQELKNSMKSFNLGEDNKLDKTIKLLNMLQLSSTIKILKSDNIPLEIIPHLFLGSIGSASNLKELQKCKITHIVCCGENIKNFFSDKFKYFNIPILDSDKEDIKKYFESSYKYIDEAIQNKGNVLVHCHAGVSRSSSFVIAYIMKSQKKKYDEVLDLVKSKRNKINPNPGFIQQLKEYEKELNII